MLQIETFLLAFKGRGVIQMSVIYGSGAASVSLTLPLRLFVVLNISCFAANAND